MAKASEQLASWYLRLNGCLLIPNYIFHALDGRQRAEVDLLGVRFPYRAEMRDTGYILRDDTVFPEQPQVVDVVLGEVKAMKACTVNSSLLDATTHNMEYALDALGVFPEAEQQGVADALRSSGAFANERYRVRLFAFGDSPNQQFSRRLPGAVQRTWPDVLAWILQRFTSRSSVLNYHDQWDDFGQMLWRTARDGQANFFEAIHDELKREAVEARGSAPEAE